MREAGGQGGTRADGRPPLARWSACFLALSAAQRVEAADLRGDAREAALSLMDVLQALPEEDLALWLELAALLDERNVRCPVALLAYLADSMPLLEGRSALRWPVHRTIRTLFECFPRLVDAYLRAVRSALERSDDVTQGVLMISDGAVFLAEDAGLVTPYLEQSPRVLATRGVEFLRAWQEEAFLIAESDWWASRAFLGAGGPSCRWLQPTDLAPLGELAIRVAARSRHGAKALFEALPFLRCVMSVSDIRRWVEKGMARYDKEQDLVLYLSYSADRRCTAWPALTD